MTDERQIAELHANQVTVKRGFPVYRTNPSIPSTTGIPTRTRRFQVPGGKAAMIVDNSTGEIKGIGGMGFWWEEEVDTTRWAVSFGMLGLFRRVLARERAWVRYMSDSAYWLYVTHVPLVIAAQAFVAPWPLPSYVKFVLVSGVVTAVLLLSYQLFVRYTWIGPPPSEEVQ